MKLGVLANLRERTGGRVENLGRVEKLTGKNHLGGSDMLDGFGNEWWVVNVKQVTIWRSLADKAAWKAASIRPAWMWAWG